MNKEQVSTLVLSALNLVPDSNASTVVSVTINEVESSALVELNSAENAQKCLDLKEIGYFGKIIKVFPPTEFVQVPEQTITSMHCDYTFPSVSAFLDALSRNRNYFTDLPQGVISVSPLVTLTLKGPSRAKVEEVRSELQQLLGGETFSTL